MGYCVLRQGTFTNRVPILGATLALVLAACSPAADAGAGDHLTLRIATPADGAEVSAPFDIAVEANVEIGESEPASAPPELPPGGDY